MRNYKFRGKDINGEWHKGNLAVITEDRANGVKAGSYISNTSGMPFAYMVDPETVGEFSGLHDSDKNEIYEDDIVAVFVGNGSIGTVEYLRGGYVYRWPDGHASPIFVSDECKVIGNIHEKAVTKCV